MKCFRIYIWHYTGIMHVPPFSNNEIDQMECIPLMTLLIFLHNFGHTFSVLTSNSTIVFFSPAIHGTFCKNLNNKQKVGCDDVILYCCGEASNSFKKKTSSLSKRNIFRSRASNQSESESPSSPSSSISAHTHRNYYFSIL